MRLLFLISDTTWSPGARAFMLAARGLAARGHDVLVACESDCPVQTRATDLSVPVISLKPDASTAGEAWRLCSTLKDREVDVIFVQSERELLVASSAARLGRGTRAIVRRVPPFTTVRQGRRARLATRISPTTVLFATEIDRAGARDLGHIASAVAPVSVDPADHDRTGAAPRSGLGVPDDARLIVCLHDGGDTHKVFSALRTIALLAPRHPELHLVVTGAGPQDEMRMHGAALGINPMVSYVGARQDELSILRAADVGWIAAEGDAAAFAALDFMAFGTPVIAERDSLTEHYVSDGIAGVLLPNADATTTAGAVAAFLAGDDQRLAMGTAARARLRREFPYDAMIAAFELAASGGSPAAAS